MAGPVLQLNHREPALPPALSPPAVTRPPPAPPPPNSPPPCLPPPRRPPQKIEGLDTLTKLTDLSLANNRIEEIRGLDKCESLEFLSLANNRLARVAQAQALRPLPKLRAVAIMGNPACAAEDDYR